MKRFTVSLLMMTLFSGPLSAAELTLIRKGQPAAPIYLPEKTEFQRYVGATDAEIDAALRERFPKADETAFAALRTKFLAFREAEAKRVGDEEQLAAEELQTYLEKITGVKPEIRKWKSGEPLPSGPAILLGSELARQAQLGKTLDELHRDGIVLRTDGDKLILSGRRARGTLFAAYEFLETLGCRWVMPGEFGELIPQQPTISTAVDKVENPSHSQRYWWCTYGNGAEYPRWTLRNKGTFIQALEDRVVRQGHALPQALVWGARHTPLGTKVKETVRRPKRDEKNQMLRDADNRILFEEVEVENIYLPDEYYALAGGKPARHTPNMANPKVWDLYADFYRRYFNETNPFEDYVSISAEDGLVLDDREESRKLDANEYDPFMGALSATDRLWFFHNRFLQKLEAELPDRKYSVLVYSNNLTPPRISTVHRQMALVFAPLGISPLFDVRNPKSKGNRAYRGWLESWMKQAQAVEAETYYYDYEPTGFQWNKAMIAPRWHIIGKNYPYFHSLGLDGHTTQGFDDWGTSGVNNWMMIRLYWNADQDYKAILADYCQRRFAEAAPAMLEYYTLLEERMNEIPELCSNEIWGNHLILTPEVRAKARAAIAKAQAAVKDERARRHVEAAAAIQKSTDAFCDGIEIARESGDFKKAAETVSQSFEIAAEMNQLYSHFMQPNTMNKENLRHYEPGGWYNKYLVWDRKISGSAASLLLPREWQMTLDTDNVAVANGWHRPGAEVSALEPWDVTIVPDVKYQTQNDVAAFFYRTEVEIPASFQGKKAALYFPSLIARALQVWVDGEPVEFDHGDYRDTIFRGPPTFWYNYDHQLEVDLAKHLKPGQKQVIAFRVFKSFDHAGTYDRIFLLGQAPAQP